MRAVKCKYCGEMITREEDKHVIIGETKTGKPKRINIHTWCLEEYNKLEEFKANEILWWDRLYKYIHTNVLGYSDNIKLPRNLITRLQDLRNGTITKKLEGRVILSKAGYGYDVILNTFLTHGDNIRYALNHKTFNNEQQKINYIMAIIDNNINDVYLEMKELEKQKMLSEEEKQINKEQIEFAMQVQEEITPQKEKGKSKVMNFISDEDDW